MKKNVKKAILLVSTLLLSQAVQAQVVKTMESSPLIPVTSTGNTYTTVSNANGDSQTVISIGPRLAIQSPWWISNMVNAATDKGNTKKTNDSKEINKDKEKVDKNLTKSNDEEKPEKVNVTQVGPEITPKNVVATNVPVEKKTGQTTFKTVVIKTNDIAGANNTSLEEMAKIGQRQTQEALRSGIQ